MEVTTAVVAAEHSHTKITMDHRIPEVQVASEEAARVRVILIVYFLEHRELQTQVVAVVVPAHLTPRMM